MENSLNTYCDHESLEKSCKSIGRMWKPCGKPYITATRFKPHMQNTKKDCYTCYTKPGSLRHAFTHMQNTCYTK